MFPNLLQVKSVDEAHQLARSLCQQHNSILNGITSEEAAKIAATKIFADELLRVSAQRELRDLVRRGQRESAIARAKEMHKGDPAGFLCTMRHVLPELYSAEVKDHAMDVLNAANEQRPEIDMKRKSARTSLETAKRKVSCSSLKACPYCDEPSTRFCKESGKRHETPEERAKRRWRTTFRQLATANKFVSFARLQKVNTCAEVFTVNLDDF
eukprot:PhF_6_TR13593/c0_g1_i1/m.21749